MGLYYVYAKHTRKGDTLRDYYGRYLLTFESRQVADEFWRALKELKTAAGVQRFTTLHRSTPQFWCYDAPEAWFAIHNVLQEDDAWGQKVIHALMSNWDATVNWNVINRVVEGSDWLNGGAFFIRNKIVPSQFWYADGSAIVPSTERRTKFVVRGTAFHKEDDEQVLIRSDKVVIEVAESTSSDRILFVGHDHGNGILTITADKSEWNFKDFFESFAAKFYTESGKNTEKEYVLYAPGFNDEWELV
ncbi:hypothetical protein PZA11_001864 [Diplocarpon coronariae]